MTRLMMRAPMLAAFGAVTLGTWAGEWVGVTTAGAFAAGLLALLGRAMRIRRGLFLVAFGVFAALGALAAARAAEQAREVTLRTCRDPSGQWRGEVVRPVRALPGTQGGGQRAFTELRWERCGDAWIPRTQWVWLRLHDAQPLFDGDTFQVRLELQALPPQRNPTDPNPRESQATAVARVRGPLVVAAPGRSLWSALDRARRHVREALDATLSPSDSAVAKALALGDRSHIADRRRMRWADAGVSHLLAVSGLHVGMVAGWAFALVYLILAPWPWAERFSPRRIASAAAFAAIVAFCVWVGAPASAVRATVMGGALLVGTVVGRRADLLNTLGLAGAWMLLVQPRALREPGFLLSFGAVLAIAMVLGRMPTAKRRWTRALRWVGAAGLASLAVSVLTLPIVAHYFGRVSVVSPLTNLIAVPVATLAVVPGALGCAMLAVASSSLGRWAGRGFEFALGLVEGWTDFVLQIPYASVELESQQAWIVLAVLLTLFALWRRVRSVWLWGAIVGVCVMVTVHGVRSSPGADTLTVTHPYVGQGDAAMVRFPGGEFMLFDAGGARFGTWEPGQRVLDPLLRRAGARRIDVAVVSHGDFDHVGGFLYLSERWEIGELWWSGDGPPSATCREVIKRVRRKGGVVRQVGELPSNFERFGAKFEILRAMGRSDNDRSVVLKLTWGNGIRLLRGGVEAGAERSLAPQLSTVDILKVPHHGSSTSSTQELLNATSPTHAVVSAGANNPFGFPAARVVDRYRARGIRLLQTARHGMVTFRTDGERWEVETYLRENSPRWR